MTDTPSDPVLPVEPEPLPALTPEIVGDDVALAEAVDELVHRDPVARRQLAEIVDHQEILRAAVDSDVWTLFLHIDELGTARFADAIVLVGRWAFNEGQKHPATPSTTPAEPASPPREGA